MTNKKNLSIAVVALSLTLLSSAWVHADDAKPSLLDPQSLDGKWVGTVAYTTEYFSRGVSNTRSGLGAVQSGLEFDHDSGAYLKAWGSNVSFPPPDSSANLELDYIGGYRGRFTEEATYDVFATYYTYPGTTRDDGRSFNYWEFTAKGIYDVEVAKPYFDVNYSPGYMFGSGYEWYFEGGAEVPLGRYFTGLVRAGHSIFQRNTLAESHDYWDYSIGIGTNIAGLDVKLEYITNNLPKSECVGACDRVVATISKTF